jgi:hypothetical protein
VHYFSTLFKQEARVTIEASFFLKVASFFPSFVNLEDNTALVAEVTQTRTSQHLTKLSKG